MGKSAARSDNFSGNQARSRLSATEIRRGAERLMVDLGYQTLAEFTLKNDRRIDLAGIDRRGVFAFVEIKSSAADFRSDRKWQGYLAYCDLFYFCVAPGFPLNLLSEAECRSERVGVIVADRFGGAVIRESSPLALNGSRRKSQTLAFARAAAGRLCRLSEGYQSSGAIAGADRLLNSSQRERPPSLSR